MGIILWFIQIIFSLITIVATYLPLIASYKEFNMWELPWQIWAMIGFTIFWISMLSIVLRLFFENRKYRSKEYQIDIEMKERKLKQLKLEQSAMDTKRLI